MLTRTERKSIEKSRLAKTKRNEKQGLFEVAFADLWRSAQQRRSAYIGLWIARIFRQSSPRNKSSDDIKATHPARQANLRKISFFAGVAALFLISVGTWIGVETWTSTSVHAGSTVDPMAIMTSAKGLPTSHYDDYSVVFKSE